MLCPDIWKERCWPLKHCHAGPHRPSMLQMIFSVELGHLRFAVIRTSNRDLALPGKKPLVCRLGASKKLFCVELVCLCRGHSDRGDRQCGNDDLLLEALRMSHIAASDLRRPGHFPE